MGAPDWILGMKDSIWEWMLSLRTGEHPGQFKWCKTGSVITPSHRTGLGASALALKVAYQIDKLPDLDAEELNLWSDHIRSFQAKHARFAGFFEDRLLLRTADRKAGWFKKDIATRRAETRQACAALLGAKASPHFPISKIPRSRQKICKYISHLPWEKNPWAAGSHVGHLMFFLKVNADIFGRHDEYKKLAPVILERLDMLQDKSTGSWFTGNPSIPQKINAAMKVLTIYNLIGKPFRWPEHLIDFCLEAATEDDACHNVDIIYVLYQCNRWTSYRRDDIRRFAERKFCAIQKHVRSDGAFSFFPNRTGTHYYGVHVSKGLPESDIHGTHLLVWAATLIADLLGFRDQLGWKLPIT